MASPFPCRALLFILERVPSFLSAETPPAAPGGPASGADHPDRVVIPCVTAPSRRDNHAKTVQEPVMNFGTRLSMGSGLRGRLRASARRKAPPAPAPTTRPTASSRLLAPPCAALPFIAALAVLFTCAPASAATPPTASLAPWVVEQMPGGTVRTDGDALVIEDAAGCTVWLRARLTAPVEISYDVTVVARGGPHDRVSDVNCFWMASDPRAPDVCPFARDHGRSGKFSDYDSLLTYYVGMGGNENTTTRFRRYDGTAARPLLPEHDLRTEPFLLEPNRTHHLRLVARDGIAEFWRDGEKLFSFRDPAPLTSGWFALRTVKSHLEIRHLEIQQHGSPVVPTR